MDGWNYGKRSFMIKDTLNLGGGGNQGDMNNVGWVGLGHGVRWVGREGERAVWMNECS